MHDDEEIRRLRGRAGGLPLAAPIAFALAGIVATCAAAQFGTHRTTMPSRDEAPAGRSTPIPTLDRHRVFGTPLAGPFAAGTEEARFALGCFWGAERRFWLLDGVVSTSAGYTGGFTPNPTYDEVCGGDTGHAETVRVIFDPSVVSYRELLRTFWEAHDPTQGMRQAGDVGTQYRSVIFVMSADQRRIAEASRDAYQAALTAAGYGAITTEIAEATPWYFAEDYHQQYLEAHPDGYCGHGGTGVSCPIGLVPAE